MKECILQNWTDFGASQDYIPLIVPSVGSASAYLSINDCHMRDGNKRYRKGKRNVVGRNRVLSDRN